MRVLSLIVALLLCAAPRPAFSEPEPTPLVDPKVEARRYFEAGVAFQKTDDFEAASEAYTTSLELYPTKSALFNLANCQRAMHQYADAWQSLERLQVQFGAELAEPMRTTSKTQQAELENLTGLVVVTTEPSGAVLTVDGKPVGSSPTVTPLRLAIGQHTVIATQDGHVAQERSFKLSPRQTLTLSLELAQASPVQAPIPQTEPKVVPAARVEPRPQAAEVPTTSTQPDEASTTWTVVGWVGVAVGALSIATGARSGILALEVDEHLAEVCAGGHCSERNRNDVERLERLTLSANVFIGAGAALMATGAAFLLLPKLSAESKPVSVFVGPTGLLLEGQF